MRGLFAVAILAWPLSLPAAAVELVDSVFQVTFKYAGQDFVYNETELPLLPANACYNWYIRLAAGDRPAVAVERFTLPVALPMADWGAAATDADDGIEIEEDGKVAVTTFVPDLDADGWFSNGWCVAEGDPLGHHLIEVSVDGEHLASYNFELVAPEDYAWPAIPQPDHRGRTVENSW